ncbi:HxlR family transcriptional regulator [Hydrogenispora ethanolica]|uniref:HxlR family transcriptional regulator n=1 Tax=Hydrogenispora ethanolica TaxID=1082276 RepID=A0A4V2QB15_HYDET|nr:helix-turn-helix domain-containing protein [Hydrogenispora ethanolica]TCL54662.1 HxlR family transcriptional regulator [Hydrogenispora ethanolica]
MGNSQKDEAPLADCPVTYALRLIGGKWQIPILWALCQNRVLRYQELKRKIAGITNMMLAQSLKELESNGLVTRIQYTEIPPRVEYSPTEAALRLLPALEELGKWGAEMKQRSLPVEGPQ